MKEIGSEFWSVPTEDRKNNLFHNDTSWFLSGRSALQSIISESKIKTIALPSWCCDSMIKPFLDAGVKVSFYPVYFDNTLIQDFSNVKAEAVLIMDYFGYKGFCDFKELDLTVIYDATHSVFSTPVIKADYYFGSLRKWAGFWTGGFAYPVNGVSNVDEKYISLRKEAMIQKELYISGDTSSKGYLNIFNEAEELLENAAVYAASPRDIEMAQHLDIDFIKSRRRENARVLLEEVHDMAMFSTMSETDCPLFVPILVPDGKRDALRKHLIEKEIYCPVHWPISDLHKLTDQTRYIYDNELSLVCDQRYTVSDMKRIIEAIKEF